jgi:hypothetical protein
MALAPIGQRRRWLLLLDDLGLGERLAAALEAAGEEICRVRAVPGRALAELDGGAYALDPARPESYGELLARLREAPPDRIVHLFSLGVPASGGVAGEASPEAQERGFFSLLALARALGELPAAGAERRLHLAVVTDGIFEVAGGEALQPEKATLLGPCRVLPQELPGVTCSVLEVALGGTAQVAPGRDETLAACLAAELLAPLGPASEPVVALRGRRRWVRRFRPLASPAAAPTATQLRQRGVFAIAGGLSDTGLAVAEHLFAAAAARLALLVPPDTPPRAGWTEWLGSLDESHADSRRIRRVLALEAAGCELLVLPVDLTQPARVAAAISRAEARFGALHGVVHTAFAAGAGLLQWKTPEQAAAVLAPAVAGTLALAAATSGKALDCFVLFGSNTAATGGFGQSDTAAAAAFLDAFAQAREAAGAPFTQAIDWGLFRWQPVSVDDAAIAEQLRAGLAAYGIGAGDCARVLERALASRLPQVTVSTQDLAAVTAQLAGYGAFPTLSLAQAGQAGPAASASSSASASHPRPELPEAFEPPEGPAEAAIAAVWREAFGLDRVGRHDNFFELGGNSLLAIQIVTRLAADSGLELSMASLLAAPTIAQLALRLPPPSQRQVADPLEPGSHLSGLAAGSPGSATPAATGDDVAELERLLAEVEALGEAGAAARLAADDAPPAGGPP